MQMEKDTLNHERDLRNLMTAGLSAPGWEPTSADVREALHDTIDYFSRGKLNEDELTWALSFLAGQMAEIELKELLENLGRRLGEEPGVAKRRP